MEQTPYRKSSYSGGNPEACVEVCLTADDARVRDSKAASSDVLKFSPDAWAAFVASRPVAD